MYKHYKRMCWEKFRGNKDKSWKPKMGYLEYRNIVNEVFDNIKADVNDGKPFTIEGFGTLQSESYDKVNNFRKNKSNVHNRLAQLMPFAEKFGKRIKWNKKKCTIPNRQYYLFKIIKSEQ